MTVRSDPFHEHPGLLAFARTPAGRVVLCFASAALLMVIDSFRLAIPAIILATLMPRRRKQVLSICGAAFLLRRLSTQSREFTNGASTWLDVIIAAAVIVALLYGLYRAATSFSRLPGVFQRHPNAWMHGVMWIAIAAACVVIQASPRGATSVALIAVTLPFLVWRCGYLLLAGRRGTAAGTRFTDHLFYLLPAYGGTAVPFGKGHDFLSRHEAVDPPSLARAQLAGIRLLALAATWRIAEHALDLLVYAPAALSGETALMVPWEGIPRLAALMNGDVHAGLATRWCSLFLDMVRVTLDIAVLGHGIIGALQLCGFYVPRNMDRPLLSTTILDLWNTFYFYFKELLVDFFFYPVFIARFRGFPRLRLFAAIFAAAFVGNTYYHFTWWTAALLQGDLTTTAAYLRSYWVYAFLLTIGVYVSMLRQEKRSHAPATAGSPGPRPGAASLRGPGRACRIRAIAGIWIYFAIINIWNIPSDQLTLTERTAFFASLLGL